MHTNFLFWCLLSCFSFVACAFWCYAPEITVESNVMKHFPDVFFLRVLVLVLTFRSWIYWVNCCIQCKGRDRLHSFACGYHFPSTTCWNAWLFPNGLGTLDKNHLTIYLKLLSGSYSIVFMTVVSNNCQMYNVFIPNQFNLSQILVFPYLPTPIYFSHLLTSLVSFKTVMTISV